MQGHKYSTLLVVAQAYISTVLNAVVLSQRKVITSRGNVIFPSWNSL